MTNFEKLEKAKVESEINKKMFHGSLLLLAIGFIPCLVMYVVAINI
jgi:hypothetical protein